jgi:hypothetical protein
MTFVEMRITPESQRDHVLALCGLILPLHTYQKLGTFAIKTEVY